MRSHIVKPKSDVSDGERLHSLALHGPAGTGKTFLVEALAGTCKVPLIEVTPSDIAKGGQAAIEQRTRAVFEALSLLSRVVILFDEFDPVLKRRDPNSDRPFNIFSFLTPGMLPKLKTLNEKVKDRSAVYVLITNLIGSLDEAAIRDGRFDKKVGIYPPDPLSRYGRFMFLCATRAGTPDDVKVRELMQKTAGKGMTALTTNGWFRLDPKKIPLANAPINCVFDKDISLPRSWPSVEDSRPDEPRGKGEAAEKEYQEWTWLEGWEKILSESPSMSMGKWLTGPTEEQAKKWAATLRNELAKKKQENVGGQD